MYNEKVLVTQGEDNNPVLLGLVQRVCYENYYTSMVLVKVIGGMRARVKIIWLTSIMRAARVDEFFFKGSIITFFLIFVGKSSSALCQ